MRQFNGVRLLVGPKYLRLYNEKRDSDIFKLKSGDRVEVVGKGDVSIIDIGGGPVSDLDYFFLQIIGNISCFVGEDSVRCEVKS